MTRQTELAAERLDALIGSGNLPADVLTIAATWRDEAGQRHELSRTRPTPDAPFGPAEHNLKDSIL